MQLTVISGKGGTGKTTIAVALAELEKNTGKVDCDVDAPNLYLYYDGRDMLREEFSGGMKVSVDTSLCTECGLCQSICQFEAIHDGKVNTLYCEGCGACVLICPSKALSLVEEKTAEVILTDTSSGVLTQARMEIGSEGSGKLITVLRKKAQGYAGDDLMIIDGSPGIGCPVIASITATDTVLIVTEPTQSGVEDLQRIVLLCQQFGVKTFVCTNKADINEEIARQIENYCLTNGLCFVGRIPYDDTVLQSINELIPIIYYSGSKANQAIREAWKRIKRQLFVSENKEERKQ